MKKALSLLVAALLVIGWSSVSQAKNYYVSGHAGMVWFDDLDLYSLESDTDGYIKTMFDSGIALTGAVGCDLGDVRGEFEMGYQVNDVVETQVIDIEDGEIDNIEDGLTGDMSLVTFMLNGYYDIPVSDSGLEFFVTAGVGSAFWSFNDVGDPDDKEGNYSNDKGSTWAYQLGAGMAIPVGDNLMLEARYRYFNTAEFTTAEDTDYFEDIDDDIDDPFNGDISSHSALIGLRYNF